MVHRGSIAAGGMVMGVRTSFSMRRRRQARWPWLLAPLAVLLVAALGAGLYLHVSYPTASPLVSGRLLLRHRGKRHAAMSQDVFGFLAYWRLTDSGYLQPDLLSEVSYFSLAAGPDGQFVKTLNGTPEPGWKAWNSSQVGDLVAETQIAGGKFLLTVAMQDPKQVAAFLADAGAQHILASNIVQLLQQDRLNGVNLDVEVTGKTSDSERQAFTGFVQALAASVRQKLPGAQVSIDLPATAARDQGLYDVPALGAAVDRAVVMSYDYYTESSDVAGPVAPMSGFAQHQYFFDVQTTYDDYVKAVPRTKLIMGVPYYGYDWPVKDNSKPLAPVLPQNDTNGYAEVLSYARMKTDGDMTPQNCHWDDTAEEPWCGYTDPQTHQEREAWFENQRSIGLKFDYARGQKLGGVAIWVTGYDGSYPELWSMLKDDFTRS